MNSIGWGAFGDCNRLKNIVVPISVEKIDAYGFVGCSALSYLIIPSQMKSIEEYAFKSCGITFLTVLGNTILKKGAFTDCRNLKDVYCYAEEAPSATEAFGVLDLSVITLHVPEKAIEKYKSTEPWYKFGEIVSLQ